jgi:hypothetical protein
VLTFFKISVKTGIYYTILIFAYFKKKKCCDLLRVSQYQTKILILLSQPEKNLRQLPPQLKNSILVEKEEGNGGRFSTSWKKTCCRYAIENMLYCRKALHQI